MHVLNATYFPEEVSEIFRLREARKLGGVVQPDINDLLDP